MKRVLGFCVLLAFFTLFMNAPERNVSAAGKDDGALHLFNGKDLTNFYTFLMAPNGQKERLGKNNDPQKVFSVVDGAIRVSGEVWGYLATETDYSDYHLTVEFKWGEKTFKPRANNARDSGVLLHAVGEDGSANGWMPSVECQMIEGGTCDLILIGTKDHPVQLTAEVEDRSGQPYYKQGGAARKFDKGRVNWYARDVNWKDEKGFRGKEDVEKPVGEWNTIECICDGDKITLYLNGKLMNVGTQCSRTKGKILFQSEGAEVFFRKIDLKPLKK
jgi:hypothetical protein